MAAITERDRRSASLRQAWAGDRLHTSGPNQRAAAAPNLTRQASPKFAAMVLQNSRQVLLASVPDRGSAGTFHAVLYVQHSFRSYKLVRSAKAAHLTRCLAGVHLLSSCTSKFNRSWQQPPPDARLRAQRSAEPLPPISSDDWDELQRLADEQQQEPQRQQAQEVKAPVTLAMVSAVA